MPEKRELSLDEIASLFPSEEEIQAQIEEAQRRREDARNTGEKYAKGADILLDAQPKRFNVISLRDWLAIAEAAGLPAVPAIHMMDMDTETPIMLLDQSEDPRYEAEFRHLIRRTTDLIDDHNGRAVLRWDVCAGGDVKMTMANGRDPFTTRMGRGVIQSMDDDNPHSVEYIPVIDDPRLIDLLGDYPQHRVPVFIRPWIDAERISVERDEEHGGSTRSYPREWRVFVLDGEITGVSNYYPQAPIPETDDEHALERASEACEAVKSVIALLREKSAEPHHPVMDMADANGLNFTMDFLEPKGGGPLMMLEGGPPSLGMWGAHPCCFEGHKIEGVALGSDRFLSPAHPDGGVAKIQVP